MIDLEIRSAKRRWTGPLAVLCGLATPFLLARCGGESAGELRLAAAGAAAESGAADGLSGAANAGATDGLSGATNTGATDALGSRAS